MGVLGFLRVLGFRVWRLGFRVSFEGLGLKFNNHVDDKVMATVAMFIFPGLVFWCPCPQPGLGFVA